MPWGRYMNTKTLSTTSTGTRMLFTTSELFPEQLVYSQILELPAGGHLLVTATTAEWSCPLKKDQLMRGVLP